MLRVVEAWLWPRRPATVRGSTPAPRSRVATKCRVVEPNVVEPDVDCEAPEGSADAIGPPGILVRAVAAEDVANGGQAELVVTMLLDGAQGARVEVDAAAATGLGRTNCGVTVDDGDGADDVELAGVGVEVAPSQAA